MSKEQPSIRARGDGPIVMVDDDDVDLKIVRRMYDRSKSTNPLIQCSSGTQFLALCEDVRSGHQRMPALVLMDINMPGLNGFETISKMRTWPEFAEVPIVAMLTSSADPADRALAHGLGVTSVFAKPFDPNEYIELFNTLV